jgi:hypothetical protein
MGMGAGLLTGALLARKGFYRLHAVCQSAIVLLNLAVIALAMFPSFHRQVSPQLPGKIGKPYYALASAHAALGVIAEIGGLYILLAAGTSLLPRRLRLTRYKFWMRIVLAAWWLVLLLGYLRPVVCPAALRSCNCRSVEGLRNQLIITGDRFGAGWVLCAPWPVVRSAGFRVCY